MRFRFLAMIVALMLFFAGQSASAGPFGIELEIDDEENSLGLAESLMMGVSADSDWFSPIIAASLVQSLTGTPFAIAPPVVELAFAAMVIIVDEEEELLVAEDVDEVFQRLRPILFSELGFIRLVCNELNVEQRKQIRNSAEASLKRSASKMTVAQEPDHAAVVGVLLEVHPDPLSAIRHDIDLAMKEVLTPEKYAQYAELAASRVAHRKQAATLAIVAQLDAALCLSFQQREKVMVEISSHWQEEWEQWLEWDSDFSELPKNLDPIVTPILDTPQAAVWKQTPKSQVEQVLVVKHEAESQFNDGWWGEVEPIAPADAGEKEDFPF